MLAAMALREFGAADSQTAARRNITAAVEERVAARLDNTPGICRQCYIHPQVFDAYPKGDLLRQMKEEALTELRGGMARLCPEEAMVLALLLRRLRREDTTTPPARRVGGAWSDTPRRARAAARRDGTADPSA